MVGISKYDMPSGSPDGSGYMIAQRGAYALEKSGNFREGAESRLVSSLPGTSRPGGGLSQADPGSMFQSLLSDLKPAGLEQKFPRAGEIKRTLNNIFGVSSEDSIPATAGMTLTLSAREEIRRMKSSLSECSMKASELERIALDKLVGTAYQKYMDCSGPNTNKNAKLVALALVRRSLAQYQKFLETRSSCFNEPVFRDMFLSVSSSNHCVDIVAAGEGANRLVPTLHPKVTSDYNSNLPPQSVLKVDVHDSFRSLNHLSEQVTMREDAWSHKVRKKELMLDVVGGSSMSSLRSPSGIGSSLLSGVKGKRSERERDGKGQNRDATSRNNTAKSAQPVLSNMKGERKNKTKPKQKTAQLSTSVNGLRSKATEASNTILPVTPKSHETVGSAKKEGLIPSQPGMQNTSNDLDLCDLQLPELDGDFSGHGQDISSWLNIDEDGMQDEDFLGLEIPMDDLSEVNMMI